MPDPARKLFDQINDLVSVWLYRRSTSLDLKGPDCIRETPAPASTRRDRVLPKTDRIGS